MLVEKARAEGYVPEQRYPLPLSSAMPDVWELWRRAKTLEWDPQTDIPWEDLHAEVTRNHTCPDIDSLLAEVRDYLQRRCQLALGHATQANKSPA